MPLDDALLTDLPEVRGVTRSGPQVVVAGTGNLVHAVTAVLAATRSSPTTSASSRPDLDDAFIALTGRDRTRELTREAA